MYVNAGGSLLYRLGSLASLPVEQHERLEGRQQSDQQGKLHPEQKTSTSFFILNLTLASSSKAHALSAKASQTAQISATADSLSRASELYAEAADLFEQVKKDASDSGVKPHPDYPDVFSKLTLSIIGMSSRPWRP